MALSVCFRQEYGLGVTGYLLTRLVQRREEMAARIYFTSLSGNNCGTETEGIRLYS